MTYYKWNKQTLQYLPISIKPQIYWFIGIIFVAMSISAGVSSRIIIERIPIIYREKPVEFSEKLLIQEMEAIKMPYKDIVLCQIRLETGHYSSLKYKNANNLTAMMVCKSRSNFQSGEYLGFASYKDWKMCLYDYCLYINKYCDDMTEEEFIYFLDKYYAPNQGYKEKIKEMLKTIKNEQ